jgi:putative tricarboxylic transport membrane protein
VLAVSSDKPIDIAPDAPTVVDQGFPEAVMVNWRGIFAPPGISDKDRKALSDTFAKLNDSGAWSKTRETNGWSDEFLDSDAFKTELDKQQTDTEALLKDLGLA